MGEKWTFEAQVGRGPLERAAPVSAVLAPPLQHWLRDQRLLAGLAQMCGARMEHAQTGELGALALLPKGPCSPELVISSLWIHSLILKRMVGGGTTHFFGNA